MEDEVRSGNEPNEDATAGNANQSGSTSSAKATGEPDLTDELFRELTVLGSRFVEVVQTAWNSDERKRIEADLKVGLSSVAESLEEGFQKVRENEQAQEVLEKADDVAGSVGEKVRSSEAVSELGNSLLRGLNALAAQLEKWTNEMTAADAGSRPAEQPKTPSADEPQDIKIDTGKIDTDQG